MNRPWRLVVADDEVQTNSGTWLKVVAVRGDLYIVRNAAGKEKVIEKNPEDRVEVRRGIVGEAADLIARAFKKSEVISSD